MKSFKQIKQAAEKGDYTTVARIIGMSPSLVHMVVKEEREDYYGIRQVFCEILQHREKLVKKQKRMMI